MKEEEIASWIVHVDERHLKLKLSSRQSREKGKVGGKNWRKIEGKYFTFTGGNEKLSVDISSDRFQQMSEIKKESKKAKLKVSSSIN